MERATTKHIILTEHLDMCRLTHLNRLSYPLMDHKLFLLGRQYILNNRRGLYLPELMGKEQLFHHLS